MHDHLTNQLTIVSGGQTGADRAALDFALEHGLPHDGWCPRGRMAEDGPLAQAYRLVETPSRKYAQRTAWNVRDSDATAVFTIREEATGGTALTLALASQQRRPCLHLAREDGRTDHAERLSAFLQEHAVRRLNVAGPRASQEPAIGDFVRQVLSAALCVAIR